MKRAKKLSDTDYRTEVEIFIGRGKGKELRQLLDIIDQLLAEVKRKGELAWRTIRDARDEA